MTFQRFVELAAGRSAQLLNHSAVANDTGVSQPTAKAWLGLLEATYVVFRLRAYHGNIRKRLVKQPKLHFVDSGMVCWLLGIRSPDQLRSHPLRGPIFETWVAAEILKHRSNAGERAVLSHYRDRRGDEVDLVVERGSGRPVLVEVKSAKTVSPALWSSAVKLADAMEDPTEVVVVYSGDDMQQRSNVTLLPWDRLGEFNWS